MAYSIRAIAAKFGEIASAARELTQQLAAWELTGTAWKAPLKHGVCQKIYLPIARSAAVFLP